MYMKKATLWLGVVLTALGVIGFIPGLTTSNGYIFGLFATNTAHNLVFLITGIVGLFAATTLASALGYLKTVAVVYALYTIIGAFYGNTQVFGFIANNWWDVALHAAVTIYAAAYGWSTAREELADRRVSPAFGEYAERDRVERPRRPRM